MHTGVFHATRNRVTAQTCPAIVFHRVQALRPFAHHARNPEQSFNIMHQSGAIVDPHRRHKGRAMARQAALAFNAFDHRAFFTADIGPSPAPQINIARRHEPRRFQSGNLLGQNVQNRRVFVAHVDKTGFRLDGPSGNQHAFEKQMRCALEIVAILERSRLALISIHRQIARPRIAAHEAPFCARWKPRTTQTAQTALLYLRLDLLPITTGAQLFKPRIATSRTIGREVFIIGNLSMGMAGGNCCQNLFGRCMINVMVAQLKHRGGITAPHAGRANNPHRFGI